MENCTKCGAKIEAGMLHSCSGRDYEAPALLAIHSELKAIRELLEKQAQVTNITVTGPTDSKAVTEAVDRATKLTAGSIAKRRETRA